MNSKKEERYEAAQILFAAFSYLHPRMQGGRAWSKPMNAEALAGCILHACMARLMGEIRAQGAGVCVGAAA